MRLTLIRHASLLIELGRQTFLVDPLMAPVSGFVFDGEEQRVYVAGDTVWCADVGDALDDHAPTVVVVNAGEARMTEGDPITMTAQDVLAVARHTPATVVAVHMEALNHCVLTRKDLAAKLADANLDVLIPADGETLMLAGA
ncbi:MBL fold metallo-hydrolase [Micromonospora sp. CPCC 205371]|nr:MBL fold metallo-hydrolase [Micromonospora sp. CPCC 205371]